MLSMDYDIRVGRYRIGMVESVSVKRSVESLCSTATIVLPSCYANRSLGIEQKLNEGDAVVIQLGYNGNLKTEFNGFLESIKTDDNAVTLECEDSTYRFRKSISDKEYKKVSAKQLVEQVVQQVDASYKVQCDYDFSYDKFVVRDATAYDILKKIQDETKANIYFDADTLHIHPQYADMADAVTVDYDFSVNIEQSDLKYMKADDRKYLVEAEGIAADGKRTKVAYGKEGGDKRSVKVYGVTDEQSLLQRAKEELALVVYTGFEGSFTGWLVPYCAPAYRVRLHDREYPEKDGTYYVIATEVSFSSSGGERSITIGKKLG